MKQIDVIRGRLQVGLLPIFLAYSPCIFAANEPTKSIEIKYQEKQSLAVLVEKLQGGEDIAKLFLESKNLFSSTQKPNPELKKIVQKNESALKYLSAAVEQNLSFIRGEVEIEKILNGVISVVQVSMMKVRLMVIEGESQKAMTELNCWLKFSASFPYDDSTLVSLRLANLIRSLVFDEIEMIEKSRFAVSLNEKQWLPWLEKINIGWPIDRVIVSEGKKVLRQRLVPVVFLVANELQKNPYQTADQVLRKTRGGVARDLEFIKLMWRDEEILAMKTEVTRLSAMKIRFASQIYLKMKQAKPTNVQSLVAVRILEQIPLNYLTGKPFELSQAALH